MTAVTLMPRRTPDRAIGRRWAALRRRMAAVSRRVGRVALLAVFTLGLFGLPLQRAPRLDTDEGIAPAPSPDVPAVSADDGPSTAKSCCSRKAAEAAVGCCCPPARQAAGSCCCLMPTAKSCCGESSGSAAQRDARRRDGPERRTPVLACPCGRHATQWVSVVTEPRLLPAAVVLAGCDGPAFRRPLSDDRPTEVCSSPETPPPRPLES